MKALNRQDVEVSRLVGCGSVVSSRLVSVLVCWYVVVYTHLQVSRFVGVLVWCVVFYSYVLVSRLVAV